MKPIAVTRTIRAPVDRVFSTISDITQFSQAVPHITDVEFLTDQRIGEGTRFRETRLMKGKPVQTELEVAEFVPNERVRMLADSHGTVWDTLFTVREMDSGTELAMVMEARARNPLAAAMNSMVRRLVLKAVEDDMDAVKAFCER